MTILDPQIVEDAGRYAGNGFGGGCSLGTPDGRGRGEGVYFCYGRKIGAGQISTMNGSTGIGHGFYRGFGDGELWYGNADGSGPAFHRK